MVCYGALVSNPKEPYSVRVLRHRKLIVAVWAVLALVGAWSASTINDHLSQSFDAPGRPAFEANKAIVEHYGNGGMIAPFVVVADPGGGVPVDSPAVRGQLRSALATVAASAPGSRLARAGDAGAGRILEAKDGEVAYGLVFPPIGPEAPDQNEAALAAVQRSAAAQDVGAALPFRSPGSRR
jgi:putative drug exporter of the RND superfamily